MLVVAYTGFLTWLFITGLIIVTLVADLFIDTFIGSSDLPIEILMWFFYAPIFELCISLDWYIVQSYFKNLWKILSFQGIKKYVNETFSGKWGRNAIAQFVGLLVFSVSSVSIIVLLLSTTGSHRYQIVAIVFAVMCLLAPVGAFGRVMLIPWGIIFCQWNRSVPEERELADEDLDEFELPASGRPAARDGQQGIGENRGQVGPAASSSGEASVNACDEFTIDEQPSTSRLSRRSSPGSMTAPSGNGTGSLADLLPGLSNVGRGRSERSRLRSRDGRRRFPSTCRSSTQVG
jgi:hypothetical protein